MHACMAARGRALLGEVLASLCETHELREGAARGVDQSDVRQECVEVQDVEAGHVVPSRHVNVGQRHVGVAVLPPFVVEPSAVPATQQCRAHASSADCILRTIAGALVP